MQWKNDFSRRSEEEEIKAHGLTLDFAEIARRGTMSKEEKLIGKSKIEIKISKRMLKHGHKNELHQSRSILVNFRIG